MSGLFNIPTADIVEDGEIRFGISYIDKGTMEYSNYERDVLAPYVHFGFLPFLEVGLKLTRRLERYEIGHNVDRVLSFKVKMVNEGSTLPAFAVGIHSIPSGTIDATHFQSLYIVATKNINEFLVFDNASFTLGYGSDAIKAADHQFVGLFGGVAFDFDLSSDFYLLPSTFSILLEHDAERFNTGLRVTLFDHIKILAGLMEMKYLSGGVSVSLRL